MMCIFFGHLAQLEQWGGGAKGTERNSKDLLVFTSHSCFLNSTDVTLTLYIACFVTRYVTRVFLK